MELSHYKRGAAGPGNTAIWPNAGPPEPYQMLGQGAAVDIIIGPALDDINNWVTLHWIDVVIIVDNAKLLI